VSQAPKTPEIPLYQGSSPIVSLRQVSGVPNIIQINTGFIGVKYLINSSTLINPHYIEKPDGALPWAGVRGSSDSIVPRRSTKVRYKIMYKIMYVIP